MTRPHMPGESAYPRDSYCKYIQQHRKQHLPRPMGIRTVARTGLRFQKLTTSLIVQRVMVYTGRRARV